MEVITARSFTLDGKKLDAGKKITTDDDTGADLIAKGFCKPKEEPKPKVEAKPAEGPKAEMKTDIPASKDKPA